MHVMKVKVKVIDITFLQATSLSGRPCTSRETCTVNLDRFPHPALPAEAEAGVCRLNCSRCSGC